MVLRNAPGHPRPLAALSPQTVVTFVQMTAAAAAAVVAALPSAVRVPHALPALPALPDLTDTSLWVPGSAHVCGVGSISVAVARQLAGSPSAWLVAVYTVLPGARANTIRVGRHVAALVQAADPGTASILEPVNVVVGVTTALPTLRLPSVPERQPPLLAALQAFRHTVASGAAPPLFPVLRGLPWHLRHVSAPSPDEVRHGVPTAVPSSVLPLHVQLLAACVPVLAALHVARVLHGDFKWDNMVLTLTAPYVIDLDLATWEGRDPEERAACFPDEELELRWPDPLSTEAVAFETSADAAGPPRVRPMTGPEGRAAFFHAIRTARFLPGWDLAFFVTSLLLDCGEAALPWVQETVFDTARLAAAGVRDLVMQRALFRVQGPGAPEALAYFLQPRALDALRIRLAQERQQLHAV